MAQAGLELKSGSCGLCFLGDEIDYQRVQALAVLNLSVNEETSEKFEKNKIIGGGEARI